MPNPDVLSGNSSATAIDRQAQDQEKPANPQSHSDNPKPRGWVARSEFATWNLYTSSM